MLQVACRHQCSARALKMYAQPVIYTDEYTRQCTFRGNWGSIMRAYRAPCRGGSVSSRLCALRLGPAPPRSHPRGDVSVFESFEDLEGAVTIDEMENSRCAFAGARPRRLGQRMPRQAPVCKTSSIFQSRFFAVSIRHVQVGGAEVLGGESTGGKQFRGAAHQQQL